jgi:Fe-S cluster assembly scaffold IscU
MMIVPRCASLSVASGHRRLESRCDAISSDFEITHLQTYQLHTMMSRNLLRTALKAKPASASSLTLMRAYHEKVLDHYNSPRNVGKMNQKDHDVGTGLVGSPSCGDVLKLQIRVGEDGKISDVKFKTFGCGSAIASSSYVTTLLQGQTLEAAGNIKNTVIAKELSLPPVKLHCSMLAEDAVKAAIKDYQTKRATIANAPINSLTGDNIAVAA